MTEEKTNIDWANVGFGYHKTDKRYVSNYKDGKWDAGVLTEDSNIVLNESAGVLQYAQTCFEGMKAYTTVDGKVVVFTMGPPDAEKALRDAMALGCDESCLITDRAVAGGDTVATAKVLAKAIQLYGEFDLILGGALSADGATGQVAAMVAEELNLPHVVEIQSVKYKEDQAGKVEVVKKMHDTSFRIACATPAVLSVNFGCNEPRLATLRSKRAAKSKPLVTYTNAELGFAAEEIGIKGSPTVTVDSFQPETKRSAKMLTGTPAELAKQLYDLIEEEKGK